jgi:hypothetical protein
MSNATRHAGPAVSGGFPGADVTDEEGAAVVVRVVCVVRVVEVGVPVGVGVPVLVLGAWVGEGGTAVVVWSGLGSAVELLDVGGAPGGAITGGRVGDGPRVGAATDG